MEILLHICCAPCTCYPIEKLKEEKIRVMGYWYNPNIHPFSEYQKRLMTVGFLSSKINLPVEYDDKYEIEKYLQGVMDNTKKGESRCSFCYYLRLKQTALYAKQHNFDAFTTTILYSNYQNHKLCQTIGEKVSKEEKIKFYYIDFRSGGKQGQKMAQELGLYKQNYCGCIFSEKERFCKKLR